MHIRETITLPDRSRVGVAIDLGIQYLVVAVSEPSGPCWVCAPATDKAVACVRNGSTSPWSVLQHSATGTVEIYRTQRDGAVVESVVLCSQLPVGPTVQVAA